MTILPLTGPPAAEVPDVPVTGAAEGNAPAASFARAVRDAFDGASAALGRADAAEHAFATHRGGLQEMVLERARADVALSLATAATSHATQALSSILGMQV